MSFWACAQLQPNRTALALGCLALAGYATYLPKIIERRRNHGKRVERTAPLFPGYAFVLIELQWHAANVAPGVHHIVRTGLSPTRVPDEVIADIRKRERHGLVQLPKRSLKPGAPVRILTGPFRDHPAILRRYVRPRAGRRAAPCARRPSARHTAGGRRRAGRLNRASQFEIRIQIRTNGVRVENGVFVCLSKSLEKFRLLMCKRKGAYPPAQRECARASDLWGTAMLQRPVSRREALR
jgi:hypothetical protein